MKPLKNINKLGRPKSQVKKKAILDTAKRLFIGSGMANTTMDDIAKEAGVSKLTIYNHFGGKEELFTHIIMSELEDKLDNKTIDKLDGSDAKKHLQTVATGFVHSIYSPSGVDLYRTVIGEAKTYPAIACAFYESGMLKGRKLLCPLLGRIEQQHDYFFEDKEEAADLFFKLFKGDLFNRAITGVENKKINWEPIIDRQIDVFLGFFKCAPQQKSVDQLALLIECVEDLILACEQSQILSSLLQKNTTNEQLKRSIIQGIKGMQLGQVTMADFLNKHTPSRKFQRQSGLDSVAEQCKDGLQRKFASHENKDFYIFHVYTKLLSYADASYKTIIALIQALNLDCYEQFHNDHIDTIEGIERTKPLLKLLLK